MSTETRSVTLTEGAFERLKAIASFRNSSVDDLVGKAVELFLFEEQTLAAHQEGLRQHDAGQYLTREEMRAKIDALVQSKQAA